jgi:4-hydroxy 2-oxovalerate aldolase
MKLLDCTLRDGGYYTNWDFDDKLVDVYMQAFNSLPVDYLEVGYRSNSMKNYLGKFFYCPTHVLEDLKAKTNKKLVIILDEKNVRAEDAENLLTSIVGLVDMVRMAIDPKNFKRALVLAKKVKQLGFEVGFNVMYMSTWRGQKEFLDLIPQVDGIADYFYMVDSYGSVFPEDVREIMQLVRSKTQVKLGFHGHNNLEMGLANTLTAIDEGVDIVDATITGMGRGAGNLKMELLLTVLNSKGKVDFPYNDLSKVVDVFTKLQDTHQWGTNLPYMVSGANSLPQKQVMKWVGKRYYSFNSIIRALHNQSKGVEDNQELPKFNFKTEHKYSKALIIGGGPSAVEHSEAISKFLKSNKNMVVIHASSKNAMNFNDIENDQYFCLVGNEGHRLEDVFANQNIHGKCILPPFPRTMGTYVPSQLKNKSYELTKVDFTEKYKDSHSALALQSVLELGLKDVYCVGYDGYQGNISKKEQELFMENEYLFALAKVGLLRLVSLTETYYSELTTSSVYAELNKNE